jgi:hypothetical protein
MNNIIFFHLTEMCGQIGHFSDVSETKFQQQIILASESIWM